MSNRQSRPSKPKPRVTYAKAAPPTESGDYVDARFDVYLDGVHIGQVTRDMENVDHGPATQVYASYRTQRVAWECEAPGYRTYLTSRTRLDAVIDLLTQKHGMTYLQAREAVGKKGL